MIAYKLLRVLKDDSISPLFINKKSRLNLNTWMQAEAHKTKGFAFRPGWHCLAEPKAPHLSLKKRAWYVVEIKDFEEFKRPISQGGKWYLAKQMKILHKL